jgi:hypothetical protein
MNEVNHILAGQKYTAGDGQTSYRAAFLQEVYDEATSSWWLWYTMGADLAPKIDAYTSGGYTLSDPTITGLYQFGMPIHKRQIVPQNKGPNQEQAIADADGENAYPRFMANQPVCYTRHNNGQEWLVYSPGPHMRQALQELWKLDKCVSRIEILCRNVDDDGRECEPLVYNGKRVYKRLVLHKNHPMAMRPTE